MALLMHAVTLRPALTSIAQALIRFGSERERRKLIERLAAEHGLGPGIDARQAHPAKALIA
ncbi:hypothetical protein [Actinoplanes sp. M2I2]|uniref:hypothetical protein n=1 Tax=Actinoplanes sp. M2I2 TaxID=1734444 RepID=UPI00202281F6|nr:hypothetical protein [Actinoplanes sp. M2I2]